MINNPPFPKVSDSPTLSFTLSSLRLSDYATLAFCTFGSWSFGYVTGKPVRGPAAATAATLGFTAGSILAYQNSSGRLMGFLENGREVKRYGTEEGRRQAKIAEEQRKIQEALRDAREE
eukprot:CAMPEP_0182463676 /NCGR_PEP_ID=MMETSP1319-20130603/7836_1 /TAXON_ID=172717 /ORGANISM="Bolidomonas pacifica, Strain RCC208" /LENGTH=118 /DNA_ID=CAMNT_0024663249 /DNA_START=30 /DNA_END=386 /DNA_ORIENTATION=+